MLESAPTNPRKSFATPEGDESLHEFPKPTPEDEKELAKKADAFATAMDNLMSEKMFKLFVRAITEKELYGSNDNLAFLQNKIVQECIDLSEEDTNLVLKRFNRSVREWFVKNYPVTTVDSRVYQRILMGMGIANTNKEYIHLDQGIKNVISFLKARVRLLDSKPTQEYKHYFSSKLDARHSIDVIEEVESGEGPMISLFQIKSSMPSTEEIEKIHLAHKQWVNEGWTDLLDYERSYVGEGSVEELSQFLKNKEKIEEAFLEFCTNPEGQDLQHLLDSLHFSDLNHRQQAWLLWKYIDLLKEQLDVAVQEGALDPETKNSLWQELSVLKEKLERKARLPKSQTLIKKVRSVISVGARSVSEREIVTSKGGKVMNIN